MKVLWVILKSPPDGGDFLLLFFTESSDFD